MENDDLTKLPNETNQDQNQEMIDNLDTSFYEDLNQNQDQGAADLQDTESTDDTLDAT